MTYPTRAKIGGKYYPINTDFRVALRCFDVIDDPDICDEERLFAVIYLLFGVVPTENIEEFRNAADKYLSAGEDQETHRARKKDMDMRQDDKYITASFMSDYHIDLSTVQMHFWQFYSLLVGLTPDSVMSRIRELRNYDISSVKDAKTRAEIAQAQRDVALRDRLSAEEQEILDDFESQLGSE